LPVTAVAFLSHLHLQSDERRIAASTCGAPGLEHCPAFLLEKLGWI
jgi:hypothetical protein